MDHFRVPKMEVNLTEIKVEDHLIKTEPEYYQESVMDNNIQVRGVKVESDFSSQTETAEKEFQCILKLRNIIMYISGLLNGIR